jgi:hypothetical protein
MYGLNVGTSCTLIINRCTIYLANPALEKLLIFGSIINVHNSGYF